MEIDNSHTLSEPLVLYGPYRILDYFASHSQLLIRGEEERDGQRVNVDLRFFGVRYVGLPAYFDSPVVSLGTEADTDGVMARLSESIHPELSRVYIVKCGAHQYPVLADGLEVSRNELPPLESSLTRW